MLSLWDEEILADPGLCFLGHFGPQIGHVLTPGSRDKSIVYLRDFMEEANHGTLDKGEVTFVILVHDECDIQQAAHCTSGD